MLLESGGLFVSIRRIQHTGQEEIIICHIKQFKVKENQDLLWNSQQTTTQI